MAGAIDWRRLHGSWLGRRHKGLLLTRVRVCVHGPVRPDDGQHAWRTLLPRAAAVNCRRALIRSLRTDRTYLAGDGVNLTDLHQFGLEHLARGLVVRRGSSRKEGAGRHGAAKTG